MYLALARKWRPQTFRELIGQEHVTRTLENALLSGRVHHAFLFTGTRGVGKTTAARILCKALNCLEGPTITPCGVCRACRDITAGISSDVQEIDAASNTGVDNVRELREKLRYLPTGGRNKIYVIDEVHMLSTAAFNALLKTLEEPPPGVVFILATTDPQKVPATILSRCQRFDFRRLAVRVIADALAAIAAAEGIAISEASLILIAKEADGSMRDAQSLLDQVLSSGMEVDDQAVVEILGVLDRRLLYQCVVGVLWCMPEQALNVVEEVYRFGYDLKGFMKELTGAIRNLNVVKLSTESARILDVSADEHTYLVDIAGRLTQEVLARQFELLVSSYDAVARAENPRFPLEMTLLRMAQIGAEAPLEQRVAAVEEVLRQMGARLDSTLEETL